MLRKLCIDICMEWSCEILFVGCLVCSYAESASRLLYKIYCELVLPVPSELEHLRTPDSAEHERSVPLSSVDAMMSYQSSSADVAQTRTTRGHPRYAKDYLLTVFIVL